MSDITIINEGEPVEEIVTVAEAFEVEAEAEVEVIEEVADAAVVIAEIEAERDITIAAIHAESVSEQRDSEEWRRNFEALQSENSRLTAELAEAQGMITALSIPPASEEAPMLESLPENVEVDPQVVVEEPPSPEEAPAKPKRLRWI